MSDENQYETLFPRAFGNEEETGLLDTTNRGFGEPYNLADNLADYIPKEFKASFIPSEYKNYNQFLTNGFRVYADYTSDNSEPSNIERCTPECATPEELAKYIRAGELLIVKVVESYLKDTSEEKSRTIKARIQRRVVDGDGSRKGCHDNFDIKHMYMLDSEQRYVMQNHLATRSFVTGAGYIDDERTYFAQKIGGLSQIQGRDFNGSMYRYTHDSPRKNDPRLEIRCNDINISDWAATVRIGTTALVLALSSTELVDEMIDGIPHISTIDYAKQNNILPIYSDGSINKKLVDYESIDYQQHIAELAMDKLQLYVDELPEDYYKIAKELYEYCEDFRKVAKGMASIELIADRTDWAAKFKVITAGIEKDRTYGILRELTDITSQAMDMKYDYIGLQANDGELLPATYGYGYKLRKRGAFKNTVKEEDVLRAYKNAPTSTRAHLRSELLKRNFIRGCDWGYIQLNRDNLIEFNDVLQTSLKPTEQ